jgi:hypothetical protein
VVPVRGRHSKKADELTEQACWRGAKGAVLTSGARQGAACGSADVLYRQIAWVFGEVEARQRVAAGEEPVSCVGIRARFCGRLVQAGS